jgi:pimeloyl-ACP methyl ester carboxylesterase
MSISPVIVLLHGATLNGRMWDPVRTRIESRYTVVAPDLPGHGSRAAVRFSLDAAIEVVRSEVFAVAPAPVILVGDSLGGYTAMAASVHVPPAQLRGLVLGGCSSNIRGTRLPPYLAQIGLIATLRALLGPKRLQARIAQQLSARVAPEHAAAMLAAGIHPEVFADCVWALNAKDFRDVVAQIPVPILFVNGDKDRGHVRFEARFVAAARFATTHRFAGVEHGVSLWRSQEFADLTADFASRVFALDARHGGMPALDSASSPAPA